METNPYGTDGRTKKIESEMMNNLLILIAAWKSIRPTGSKTKKYE